MRYAADRMEQLERELTAVTEQLDSYKERYIKLAGKYAIEMHEITAQRDEARAESIRWMSIAEGRGRTDECNDSDTPRTDHVVKKSDQKDAEMAFVIMTDHADCLERELTAVTEQRDRLAEALRELCIALLTDTQPDITELLNKAGAAMAAVNYSNMEKQKP